MFAQCLTLVWFLLTNISFSDAFYQVGTGTFIVETNKRIVSWNAPLKASSSEDCLLLCTNSDVCCSASYYEKTMFCYLNNDCPPEMENVTNSKAFIRKSECEHDGYLYYTKANACLKLGETRGITWMNARTVCLENGGDLTSIKTVEKMDFMLNFIRETDGVWIGLRSGKWMTRDIFMDVYNISVTLNNVDTGYRQDSDVTCGLLKSTELVDRSCNFRNKKYFVCEIVLQM
ncbi:unnamed protein product [Mytilus coruscus]|uniref:C-type lectin domain-containing protein n=1 Tax=Mytilus coruscus TaxID=42192 RepID=A0A6J8EAG8_MYTCO|nr:unnamed protein product [Mytilus coruscus]